MTESLCECGAPRCEREGCQDRPTVPQEQKLDRRTIRRWRSEAITTSAQDRLWPNRCEALCNALLDAQARLEADRG